LEIKQGFRQSFQLLQRQGSDADVLLGVEAAATAAELAQGQP